MRHSVRNNLHSNNFKPIDTMTITFRFMNKTDRYGRDSLRYDIAHTDTQGKKNRKFVPKTQKRCRRLRIGDLLVI